MMEFLKNRSVFMHKELIEGAPLHCAHTARYFWTKLPPKSPKAHPFQTPLKLGDPNYPSSTHFVRRLQSMRYLCPSTLPF